MAIMETSKTNGASARILKLHQILNHERTFALERVREFRAKQEEEALPPPADELDSARSLEDVETHASLIERAEERLKAIDFAFSRLDRGLYGICAQCGDHIAVARLKAVPFAICCVDCQEDINRQVRPSKEWIDKPLIHQWDPPAEMTITSDLPRDESSPGPEELAIEITTENQPSDQLGRQAKKGRAKHQ
jgi:DnaK suppressor protein